MTVLRLLLITGIILAIAGCARRSESTRPVGSDRYQVAELALRSLMKPDPNSPWSEFVVDGGEFTSQLATAFADYKPRVVGNVQIGYDKNLAAFDKATGKPVELWQVSNVEIHGDNATAKVYAHQSGEGAEWYTVHLKRADGNWVVVTQTLDLVS